MATITPGTGGTILSTTAEGQLQEILGYIRQKEAVANTNPEEITAVNGSHSQNSLTYSGNFDFPCTQAINGTGQLVISATHYLSTPSFAPGTGGTFKSTTPEAYALEVLMYLQGLEQISGNNPSNRNFITGSFNSDTGRYSGTFSLPVALSLVSGLPTYTATEYLT